jgi:hypothetical protein
MRGKKGSVAWEETGDRLMAIYSVGSGQVGAWAGEGPWEVLYAGGSVAVC